MLALHDGELDLGVGLVRRDPQRVGAKADHVDTLAVMGQVEVRGVEFERGVRVAIQHVERIADLLDATGLEEADDVLHDGDAGPQSHDGAHGLVEGV